MFLLNVLLGMELPCSVVYSPISVYFPAMLDFNELVVDFSSRKLLPCGALFRPLFFFVLHGRVGAIECVK